MQRKDKYSKKYYIIFCKSNILDWRLKLLNPDFQHVLVARKSDTGYLWIIVDSAYGNIYVDLRNMCDLEDLFPGSVILEYRSKINRTIHAKIGLISCVEMVKSFLGIRKWNIWTPYQLYKYIIKQNEKGQSKAHYNIR